MNTVSENISGKKVMSDSGNQTSSHFLDIVSSKVTEIQICGQ